MPTPPCAGRQPISTASRCPSRVRHVTEFLADELQADRLKLAKAGTGKTTFHDPCQLVRKGGVNDAPRALMKAMGIELDELKITGDSATAAAGAAAYSTSNARRRCAIGRWRTRCVKSTTPAPRPSSPAVRTAGALSTTLKPLQLGQGARAVCSSWWRDNLAGAGSRT